VGTAEWAAQPPPGRVETGADPKTPESRVLFTRFIRRRNFSGFAFWVSSPPEICSTIATRARDFAEAGGYSQSLALADYSPDTIGLFREKQWLPERPVSFPGKREFKILFLGANPSDHALCGEVEHWTQIQIRPGLPDGPGVPVLPEPGEPFSHSPLYGFLTSNPAYAGTGFQAETGIHLPALTAGRRLQQVQQALNAVGIGLEPLSLRAPGAAEAGFFRVAMRGGLEESESAGYGTFVKNLKCVLNAEASALEQWQNKEKNPLEDRITRSIALMRGARSLGYAELLTFLSFARVGVHLGRFPASWMARLENLRIRCQPFHCTALLQTKISQNEEDIFRAQAVRAELEGLET